MVTNLLLLLFNAVIGDIMCLNVSCPFCGSNDISVPKNTGILMSYYCSNCNFYFNDIIVMHVVANRL